MKRVTYKDFIAYLSSLNKTLSIKYIDGIKYYFVKSAIKAKIIDGQYFIL